MLFTLPETALADVTGYIGDVLSDGWVVIALVIGVPFAFYVVNKIISLVTRRAK